MQWSFRYTPAILLSVLGLVVSIGLFTYVKQSKETENRHHFEKNMGRLIERLDNDMNSQFQELEYIALFFGASELVDRFNFYNLATPLYKKSSSLQSIQWIPIVPHDERERYESFAQHDGFPAFHFLEKNSEGKTVFAKDRETYYPIFYIEPYKNHEELLGLDMASDTLWFASLQQVLDNKTPSLSKTKIIRSNSVDAPLALMIAPIFNNRLGFNSSPALRNPISGFIVAELHIDRLINKLLLNLRHDDVIMENFQIQLYEMNGDETQQLILTKTYTTTASTTDPGQHTGLQRFNKDFVFKNRLWHIAIVNNNPKEALDTLIEATKIALFSLSLFTLLVMYSIRIVRSQNKIQKLMDQQTQLLSDTEQKVLNIMDCMAEGFICFYPDKRIRAVNQKAEQIFSYSPGEMTGLDITTLLPNLQQDFASIPVRMLSNENSPRQFIDGLNKTGVFLTLSATFIKADERDSLLYFCVFDDMSEKIKSDLARTQVVDRLTQDIKTPLTAIKGAVDFIATHEENALSDQNQRMLNMIKNNNERLAELINELIHTLK